jgi:hypothetical protein
MTILPNPVATVRPPRNRLFTRTRVRRTRVSVERLESRYLLAASLLLVKQFAELSLPSLEAFVKLHGDASYFMQPSSDGGELGPSASGSSTPSSSNIVSGSLGDHDALDLYYLGPWTPAVSLRLEVATAAHTTDAARLWLIDAAGNILADLAPTAGALTEWIQPSPSNGVFVAVVHGMDFSTSAAVSYRIIGKSIPMFGPIFVVPCGMGGPPVPSVFRAPPTDAPAPIPSPDPTPAPPTSTGSPPSSPPPSTVPTSPGTGSDNGNGSGKPLDPGPSATDSPPALRPPPLLTGTPLVGAFADHATPDLLATEATTEVDLARLKMAIIRGAVATEFSDSRRSSGWLSGILARSISGITTGAQRLAGTWPLLPSADAAAAEGTLNALPDLGTSSIGPLEGGFSTSRRSTASTLPTLAPNPPTLAPTPISRTIPPDSRSLPVPSSNEDRAPDRRAWWNGAVAMALSLASLATLSVVHSRNARRDRTHSNLIA